MIPTDAINKIRKVYIYHDAWSIHGFTFLDKDGHSLWEIGDLESLGGLSAVEIAENERIVGVVAKFGDYECCTYTDL